MSLTRYNPAHRTLSVASRTYDVFLSFQREDIGKTFVDHLRTSLENAGMNAFVDNQNLNKGDDISSTIQEAIDNSAILIPIFTKKYAESCRCLDEVSHMCKCSGVIIPLFYDVKPTEVRNPGRGAFANAFEKKKGGFSQQRISEWKAALSKVSSFSGWCKDDTLGWNHLEILRLENIFLILQSLNYCNPPKTAMVELPDFGPLQSLQELSISECKNVRRLQGVEGQNSLRRLHVPGCRLASPGHSILKPRQLIKETHCLELFSFSADGVPECLEHKMESNGDDLLYVTLDSNEQCSGFVLCFVVRFRGGITSLNIDLSTSRDGKEIFYTRLVNHSKNVTRSDFCSHIAKKSSFGEDCAEWRCGPCQSRRRGTKEVNKKWWNAVLH